MRPRNEMIDVNNSRAAYSHALRHPSRGRSVYRIGSVASSLSPPCARFDARRDSSWMRRLACDLSFCDALGSRNTFSASAIASFRRSSLSNPLSSPRPTEPDAEIHKSIKAAAALLASSVVASTVALAACCPWGLASQSAPTTPAPMSIGTAIATFPDGSLGGTPESRGRRDPGRQPHAFA